LQVVVLRILKHSAIWLLTVEVRGGVSRHSQLIGYEFYLLFLLTGLLFTICFAVMIVKVYEFTVKIALFITDLK